MSGQRLYGNWLRPQRMTVRGLPWPVAAGVVAAYLAGLVVAQSNPARGAAMLVGTAVVTVAAAARVGGTSLAAWAAARARWRWARARGAATFTAITPAGWGLPGPLADTVMVAVPHPDGAYGAVHHRRTRRLAVTVRVDPPVADLAEPGAHDASVAAWERWLELLGHHREVVHVTVTVETGTLPPSRLRHGIEQRVVAGAPGDCRALLEAVTRATAAAAVRSRTRLTVVFDPRAWDARVPRRTRRRGVEAYLPWAAAAVDQLTAALAGCGLGVVEVLGPSQLAGVVRAAFDPAAEDAVEKALLLGRGDVLDWDHAGPVTARERRDHYLHDTAASASFVWAQAPRHLVTSRVLDPLTRPGSGRKRVSITYQPTPAADVMDAATAQVRRRRLAAMVAALPLIGRAATAQDHRDDDAADQATREVAAGAGWVAATLTATVTAPDETALRDAVADLEQAAGAAQVRLRPATGLQGAAFLTGLPAGLTLPDLARRWTR